MKQTNGCRLGSLLLDQAHECHWLSGDPNSENEGWETDDEGGPLKGVLKTFIYLIEDVGKKKVGVLLDDSIEKAANNSENKYQMKNRH